MTEHISTDDLKQYLLGDLTAPELSAFDVHIGKCDECRRMAMRRTDLVISAETLERAMSARWPIHLAFADIEGLVDNSLAGTALERAEEHVLECPECRDEVDVLRPFDVVKHFADLAANAIFIDQPDGGFTHGAVCRESWPEG